MIHPSDSTGGRASARFTLGRVYATPAVIQKVPSSEIHAALRRHETGDWGEVDAGDQQANEQAIIEGTRLLSAYRSACGLKFWIITEANRSATTVLFPAEY